LTEYVYKAARLTSSSAVADKPARRIACTTSGKMLKQLRYYNHDLLLVICHIDIAYSCTKFDDFRCSRSSDMIGAPKFCNGSHDLTTPLSGTVCRP